MRTTIDLDDELLGRAMRVTGSRTKKDAVERAIRDLVERAAIQALIDLGGTMPDLQAPRRRRW